MAEKTRYSEEELQEFQELIDSKLERSRKELNYLQEQIKNLSDGSETKVMSIDDGSSTLEKEYLNQMAVRQMQYIKHLDNALIRIKNKTYGICRVTEKLIPKARLMAVPHATLSIAAKQQQSKNSGRRK